METVEMIRLINLLIRVATCGLCLVAWIERPRMRPLIVPPASWAIHGIAFYTTLLMGVALGPGVLTVWAAALGLHVGILIMAGVWLFVWPARGLRS